MCRKMKAAPGSPDFVTGGRRRPEPKNIINDGPPFDMAQAAGLSGLGAGLIGPAPFLYRLN
jgi:hypothetical protein